MNKSKFLKKSLAMLLALMLVFAMIPLSASAAPSDKFDVKVPDGQKANIIVCISGVDHYSHWHALEDIYQYFERQNHVDEILGRIPYLQGGNRDEKN